MNSQERTIKIVVDGLKKLREDFIKKAKKADEQGLEALTGPKGGCANWTEAQWRKYNSQTSEQRMAESDRLMDLQIDYERAAEEISHLLFIQSHRYR